MPMIISFAKTTGALLAGKKTVTRRDWPDSHAAKFKPGAVAMAYDKQPMYGGRPVARIEILKIERESLNELLADDRYGAPSSLARAGCGATCKTSSRSLSAVATETLTA
jgi:uncharacterized protein YqfB (UPF0267 family)